MQQIGWRWVLVLLVSIGKILLAWYAWRSTQGIVSLMTVASYKKGSIKTVNPILPVSALASY